MMVFKALKATTLVSLLSIVGSQAFAAVLWAPDLKQWTSTTYHNPFPDAAVATVANSIKIKIQEVIADDREFSLEHTVVPKSYFLSGQLPYYLGKTKSKKVMVIFPGTFSAFRSAPGKRMRKLFTQNGYRVIFFPNTFSTDLIDQKPAFAPASIEDEADLFYRALVDIRESQKLQDTTIELYGESYGALLAAAVAKIDDSQKNFVQRVTSVCPPFDMKRSVKIIDENIDKYQNWRGMLLESRIKIALDYARASHQNLLPIAGWSAVDKARATAFVLGFQEGLKHATAEWKKVFGLQQKVEADLDFSSFERNFLRPVISKVYTGTRNIEDFVGVGGARSHKVRVLTTRDDIINDVGMLAEGPSFNSDNLLVLPSGGHLGFSGTLWYENFLKRAFAN